MKAGDIVDIDSPRGRIKIVIRKIIGLHKGKVIIVAEQWPTEAGKG